LCDRILVMADGAIVADLAREEASEQRVLEIITAATAHDTVMEAT